MVHRRDSNLRVAKPPEPGKLGPHERKGAQTPMCGKAIDVIDLHEVVRRIRAGQNNTRISADLELNRRTVSKYRQWAKRHGLIDQAEAPSHGQVMALLKATRSESAGPSRPSKAEPYRDQIIAWREEGVEIQAIVERLSELQENPYTGSYATIQRFVRELEAQTPEAVIRVETAPGAEAQVDFGEVKPMYDPHTRRLRRTWAFVMTLSWSRHQYVEFVFDQTSATWLGCHRRAFEFLCGVPQTIKLDNLKAAIIKPDLEDPLVQLAYRQLAEHYGCLLSPCRVRRPEHKGKVENGVHYVQRNFLGGRRFDTPERSIRVANTLVLVWVRDRAGERIHGTTRERPLVRFTQVERAALQALPAEPFEPETWKVCKLHQDCHIQVEQARYSAPHRLIGQHLQVAITDKAVRIYHDYQPIFVHSRVSAGGWATHLDHYPPEKRAGLNLTRETAQTRAAAIGSHTATVIAAWLADRPLDRMRAIHRLLRHAPAEIERACERAVQAGDTTVRTVFNILRLKPNTPLDPNPTPAPASARFARDVTELVPVTYASR